MMNEHDERLELCQFLYGKLAELPRSREIYVDLLGANIYEVIFSFYSNKKLQFFFFIAVADNCDFIRVYFDVGRVPDDLFKIVNKEYKFKLEEPGCVEKIVDIARTTFDYFKD